MINNSNFKVKEIPSFHPIADKYERLRWWKQQKQYCIEGYWSSGKWMPPELYYYTNFHNITMEDGIYRGIGLPWCRDIEWDKAYMYAEATGFSGFELDDEYSCNRLLNNPELTDNDLMIFCRNSKGEFNQKYLNNFFKPNGTRKIYIPARKYLNKVYNNSLGKPIYFNPAMHIFEMGPRGYGKSMMTSGFIAHNFLFSGARDYDEYLIAKQNENPLKTETVVGSVDTKYSYKLTDKVSTGLTRLPGSSTINLNGESTFFPSPLAVSTEGSFAVGKTFKASISGSIIQHVTFADNPFAANGGRPNKIFIDEVGFQRNILETWEAIESTQANETFKRLTIYAMGTGGLSSAGAVTYAQEIYYNPESYNCIAYEDIWEHKGNIGYFIPTTKATNKYKEGPNYITNETKALSDVEKERDKARESKSKTKLLGLIINKPLKPSEIFLRLEGSFFNTVELKHTLADLESNPRLLDLSWKVDLHMPKEGVIEALPSNKPVLRDFPLRRGTDLDACIEIFEKPKFDPVTGKPFSNRYAIANDPVDDDENDDIKRSLQSTFVMDLWTDRIVAEYTARTYLVDTYYENVRRLCMYYNAQVLYENNKKGLYQYFKNKGSTHWLAETPEIFKEQKLFRGDSITNKSVGVNMGSDKAKLYGLNRIKTWLDMPAQVNNEEDQGKTNAQMIRSVALLKELIAYSMDLNADRVSAMLILMLYRDEKQLLVQAEKTYGSYKTPADDKFWSRAYKKYNKNNVYNDMRNYKPYAFRNN